MVPESEFEEAAMKMAHDLAEKSPVALRIGKAGFYRVLSMTNEEAVDYSIEMMGILTSSEDAREGASAFMEKRSPRWKGQ